MESRLVPTRLPKSIQKVALILRNLKEADENDEHLDVYSKGRRGRM